MIEIHTRQTNIDHLTPHSLEIYTLEINKAKI